MKNLYNEFEKNKEFEVYLNKENRSDITLDYSLWMDWFVTWENIDWEAVVKKCREEEKKYCSPRTFNKDTLFSPLKSSINTAEWDKIIDSVQEEIKDFNAKNEFDPKILREPMRV